MGCKGVFITRASYHDVSNPYSLSLLQSCGSKKRAINEDTESAGEVTLKTGRALDSTGEVTLKTGRALHILPDGGMSAAPTIGGKVIL